MSANFGSGTLDAGDDADPARPAGDAGSGPAGLGVRQRHDHDWQSAPSIEAPYGAWASPLSAARATAGALRLGQIALDGDDVYWLEGRASEGGRNVLVRASAGAPPVDVSPPGFNVRTRVHEYGGAAYVVHAARSTPRISPISASTTSRPAGRSARSRPRATSTRSA